MLTLVRTNKDNPDFHQLVTALDADLAITDGEDHTFYNQFNGIENIKYVVLGYIDRQAIACGAIKKYSPTQMEVKRMYVNPDHRGKAYAGIILNELEAWSADLGYSYCILETGINQTPAIKLYLKAGYERTENYGQYIGIANSLCFRKGVRG